MLVTRLNLVELELIAADRHVSAVYFCGVEKRFVLNDWKLRIASRPAFLELPLLPFAGHREVVKVNYKDAHEDRDSEVNAVEVFEEQKHEVLHDQRETDEKPGVPVTVADTDYLQRKGVSNFGSLLTIVRMQAARTTIGNNAYSKSTMSKILLKSWLLLASECRRFNDGRTLEQNTMT